jgi:hypothetical protein
MPFEKLMEHVAAIDSRDGVTFGELSRRWGEPPERIMDAVSAVRVMCGELTYIGVPADS